MIVEDRNKVVDGWRGLSVVPVIVANILVYRFAGYRDLIPLHEMPVSPYLLAADIFVRMVAPLGEMGIQFFMPAFYTDATSSWTGLI